MYKNNRLILIKNYPSIAKQLENFKNEDSQFQVKTTEKGMKYIEGQIGLKKVKIHSKYDPGRETELFLKKYESSIETHDYIFFFGMGLGYHIALFKEKYPNKIIYAYEPNVEIFSFYMKYADLEILDKVFVGSFEKNYPLFVEIVFRKKVLIISYPVYENEFKEELKLFKEKQLEILKAQKNELAIIAQFEKRWVLNALYNYPEIARTPSVLHPVFCTYFKDKPIIIVSAGPSLDDEIENLRKIKEEGRAYIFTVGSSLNALLSHGITPDAACSYDPAEENMDIYRTVIIHNNKEIPLLFSSTFTTEIVKSYPGKKAHFILSQDFLNPILQDVSKEELVSDAPTVATILLQILLRWETQTIILVGQNLAYRNKTMYAGGITYRQSWSQDDVSEEKLILVKSVTGEKVYTSDFFNDMRSSIESVLRAFGRDDIINATADGAHIEGTTFMRLSDLMNEKLKNKVVDENWYEKVTSKIPVEDREKKAEKLEKIRKDFLNSRNIFEQQIRQVRRNLSNMDKNIRLSKLKQVLRDSDKYEKSMVQVENNIYYNTLIMPFLKVFLIKQNLKLQEIKHRNLPELDYYKEKRKILAPAIEMVSDIHKMMNRDVEKVLGYGMERDKQ